MNPFTLNNPTVLHFGKDCIQDLAKTASNYGKNILLVYGKGSIKSNGIYDAVLEQLNKNDSTIHEYSGIKSNPIASDVNRAAEFARENNIDLIVAIGGGSVIDTAKMLSITAISNCDVWDFYSKKAQANSSIPLIAVLSLAATGTEMNPYAVIQNDETKEKYGYGNPLIYPNHSFLDPSYTLSVPANYTAYGIVDLIAHSLEQYFGAGFSPLADRIVEAIITEAIHYGRILMKDLSNYEAREMIMWLATNALNGTTGHGRISGDWGVHGIEHSLSVLFDIPHGAGLSIVYPAWLKHHKEKASERIQQLGKRVFATDHIEECISRFENFFKETGSPTRLDDIQISRDSEEDIIQNLHHTKANGANYKLDDSAYRGIVDLMYG